MIYLFAGDDTKTKLASYEKFIGKVAKSTATFFVGKNDFDRLQAESFYSGAGLFFSKSVVVYSNIFEREDTLDFVLDRLPEFAAAGNDFVFVEGRLVKPVLDAFKKARAELNIFELPKEKKEKFNSFVLADAFCERNKLNLWINFRLAIDKGVGMEELIGILFWKAKDMILKRSFSKFTETELQNFAAKLSYLLPEARRDGRDDEAAFEQFLLEAF